MHNCFSKKTCWNPYFYSVFWVRAFWARCKKGKFWTPTKIKEKLTDNWKALFWYFCCFFCSFFFVPFLSLLLIEEPCFFPLKRACQGERVHVLGHPLLDEIEGAWKDPDQRRLPHPLSVFPQSLGSLPRIPTASPCTPSFPGSLCSTFGEIAEGLVAGWGNCNFGPWFSMLVGTRPQADLICRWAGALRVSHSNVNNNVIATKTAPANWEEISTHNAMEFGGLWEGTGQTTERHTCIWTP